MFLDLPASVTFFRRLRPVPLRLVDWADVLKRNPPRFVGIAAKVLNNIGEIARVFAFRPGLQIGCVAVGIRVGQPVPRQAIGWAKYRMLASGIPQCSAEIRGAWRPARPK